MSNHFSAAIVTQSHGLDSDGALTKSLVSNPIEIELVQGVREAVYWERVPEKVRKQALATAYPHLAVADEGSTEPRRPKRRKVA